MKKLFLAGGFARYLDFGNAVACGMLPDCELAAELERLIDLPKDIPLNLLDEFEDNYIDGLLLP